jgi:hypothetical protein
LIRFFIYLEESETTLVTTLLFLGVHCQTIARPAPALKKTPRALPSLGPPAHLAPASVGLVAAEQCRSFFGAPRNYLAASPHHTAWATCVAPVNTVSIIASSSISFQQLFTKRALIDLFVILSYRLPPSGENPHRSAVLRCCKLELLRSQPSACISASRRDTSDCA